MSPASPAGLAVDHIRFNSGFHHLSAELKRLDLIIARRVQRFRLEIAETEARVPAAPTYVSDPEVDWLLQRPHGDGRQHESIRELDNEIAAQERLIDAAIAASEQDDVALPLRLLAKMFNLSWLEQQVVLICLAPELRRKYDRIYAYLQDDITRKRPSLDLVLELLFDDECERWRARTWLDDNGSLFSHKLVHAIEDPHSPSGSSGLARLLQLDSRILQFLLDNGQIDARVAGLARLIPPEQSRPCVDPAQLSDLQRLLDNCLNGAAPRRLLLHLQGMEGGGQRDLVIALCQAMGCPLLLADGRALSAAGNHGEAGLRLLCRESLLLQAPLLIENIDDWLPNENAARSRLSLLSEMLNHYFWLNFTTAQKSWPGAQAPLNAILLNISVQPPDDEQQAQLWQQALAGIKIDGTRQELDHLLQQFRLSRHQIELVARRLRLQNPGSGKALSQSVLARACSDVSHHALGDLSVRVKAQYRWDDLVLPEELHDWLQNICAQVRFRRQVFDQWGFAQKLPYGRGLSVLFSGNPGTGKTMAAQVMANDLGLELYKIDLSGVVSKYIGETEKNLNRVFTEAQTSNAILFFDEADALFGKRTGVSDAHDRYANIEVSYLLQKMEEYDGIVILATNLRNNIDEAFVRRIRFILEFPFPDAGNRLQIWRKSIPAATPVAEDIDYRWLAERIKVAGGNIKNIILNAAFSAARDNQPLGMRHLLGGCKQEFQKIGKLWDETAMRSQKQTIEVAHRD